MSMTLLTILQFAGTFCAYFFMSFALPAFVLRKKFIKRKWAERMMFYFLIGNFYMISIVFLLELFHIAYRPVVILATIIPAAAVEVYFHGTEILQKAADFFAVLKRISDRQMGWKTILLKAVQRLGRYIKKGFARAGKLFLNHSLEWVLTAAVMALVLWIYGSQIFKYFGFADRELFLHTSWINGLADQKLFADGVYPFGFHCVIYYLHEIFGIDIYVLMRVFGLVQAILVHLMLLWFLKLCCRGRYLPYAGVLLFAAGGFLAENVSSGFCCALPQQFGLIFLLPAFYFALQFFKERRAEVMAETEFGKAKEKFSLFCLAGFALGVSQVTAIHFYDGAALGMFCIGIFFGYIFLIFRRKYFFQVFVTVIVSFLIGILPVGAACLAGIPLENLFLQEISSDVEDGADEKLGEENNGNDISNAAINNNTDGNENVMPDVPEKKGFWEAAGTVTGGMAGRLKYMLAEMEKQLCAWVFHSDVSWMSSVVMVCMLGLFLLGILFFVCKEPCYGAMLISTDIFLFLLALLQSGKALKLPFALDEAKCSVLVSYVLAVFFVFCADAVIFLAGRAIKWRGIMPFLSFMVLAAIAAGMVLTKTIQKPKDLGALELNEAITCLTNIIKDEKDLTWMICSAEDEQYLAKGHGYHYEAIDFLRALESSEEGSLVTLPAESVYFFIEKVPQDSFVSYEGSGQTISMRGVMKDLPVGNGTAVYEGENRWIVMSKMYCWAREYQKYYPQEMSVYMETEEFVCYRLEQNPHRLLNLAVDE